MDFKTLITLRRSHRRFTADPVAAEDTRAILRAALIAPSSKGTHSYTFCAVEDKELIQQLAHAKDAGAEFLASAPLVIVVSGRPAISDAWIEDASIAATHILLQAEDLGLGACWAQMRMRHQPDGTSANEAIHKILGLPQDHEVLCAIGIGHKGAERKPQNEERLQWDNIIWK